MLCIDLTEKRALITGSTRGIGRSIAEFLAKAGAKVVITGRDQLRTQEVARRIAEDFGVETLGLAMNMEDKTSIETAYSKIEKEWGGVDILVNNAGITRDRLFIRLSMEDWEEVLRVNLTGTFIITSLAVKGMLKNRWGRIINVSSVVGFTGNVGQVNYSSTKSALIGFTKSLAKELAGRSITVNAVAPGFIETDMTAVLKEELKQEYLKTIPLGRLGKPEDVAGAVLFLCSNHASYITGEVIQVNGGMY
ncbi:MAG: 3-oxoacyl-[acyl-carrier-protein] reductase [Aquificaceae bacterium]